MKRFVAAAALLALLASPAMAISEFHKQWRALYLDDNPNEEFVKTARRASCNTCHIKGEKKDVNNEYGLQLSELLDHDDFPTERIKAEPEVVAKEVQEAIKKIADKKSKDGRKFGEKIEAGEMPATDAGL